MHVDFLLTFNSDFYCYRKMNRSIIRVEDENVSGLNNCSIFFANEYISRGPFETYTIRLMYIQKMS